MGGPGGGGPHGTPLRLGTRSRHGRRAPRGAPLHGGRQRQIRGSVPSRGARVLEVRIHLPPAESRTNSEASEEAVEGACQRSTDAYGALIAARPSAPGANVADVDGALGGKVHGAPGTKAPNPGTRRAVEIPAIL